ncbi:MAG: choice-of-anchor L domain-containing protein [Pseudomonadota bacterium]
MFRFTTILAVGAMSAASSAHALTISATDDANALADALIGTGVTITSSSLSGATPTAAGGFGDGLSAGIGIEEGVILTSGDANLAPGPNTADNATGGGTQTTLSISFTTTTGDLFFNYVWASEEYNEFVNSAFNDTFEFLLSGPGITGSQNIALIPGTNDPVEIDTVNNNVNSDLFNDNDFGDFGGSTPFDIEYDGFTDVFTASATGLNIGDVYTIDLIVSDVGDTAFDSAVFIQGESFGGVTPPDTPSPIPLPASLPLMLAGLGVFGFLRRKMR